MGPRARLDVLETENFLGYSGIRTMNRPASNLVTTITVLPWLQFWVLIKKLILRSFIWKKQIHVKIPGVHLDSHFCTGICCSRFAYRGFYHTLVYKPRGMERNASNT